MSDRGPALASKGDILRGPSLDELVASLRSVDHQGAVGFTCVLGYTPAGSKQEYESEFALVGIVASLAVDSEGRRGSDWLVGLETPNGLRTVTFNHETGHGRIV